MAKAPREGQLLYHFTNILNLESILQYGLMPREKVNCDFVDIADSKIIDYRKELGLLKFVPFHFFAPSPFVGAVQTAYPDEIFIHICIKREYARKNNFQILPSHPLSHNLKAINEIQLFSYREGINQINWDLMAERDYYNDECRCVCLAECLTDKTIKYPDFHCIFVQDENSKDFVLAIFSHIMGHNHNKRKDFFIDIEDWCFKKNV